MSIMIGDQNLYEALGGRPTLERVHSILYTKLFNHPWLKNFFRDLKREHIEAQQTDFMAQAMGGPKKYAGKLPIPGHKHIMITKEVFDTRHALLVEALREAGVSDDLAAHWIKIDGAFRNGLVKENITECEERYNGSGILDFQNPYKKRAA